MKILSPYRSSSGLQQRSALTILEMLVSTAMLSFIVLGLTAVFIQTQRAFKTGIKSTTVTDAGRTILDMISADLSQISDGQNTNVVNLYWSWNSSTNIQLTNNVGFRTNQLDAIYILEHTNNTWMGVGYAVQNVLPGVGTLYRYETNLDAPFVLTNGLFTQFSNSVQFQNFTNQAFWHRIADGIIHLKLRTFDQNGNEPYIESTYYGDYYPEFAEMSYPLRMTPYLYPFVSNTLPTSVELEVGILEPEALVRAESLAGAPTALNNFMQTNSLTMMEIFRQRVSIPVVAR